MAAATRHTWRRQVCQFSLFPRQQSSLPTEGNKHNYVNYTTSCIVQWTLTTTMPEQQLRADWSGGARAAATAINHGAARK